MSDETAVHYDVIGDDGVTIEGGIPLDAARELSARIVNNGHDAPEIKASAEQPEGSGMELEAPELPDPPKKGKKAEGSA